MCGRYVQSLSADELMEAFDLVERPEGVQRRYNLAPSERAPVVRAEAAGRVARHLQWGLVPSWADDPSIGLRLINARAESAASKPAFRQAMARRRCLVPASGFYEWQATGSAKQPWYIHSAEGRPLALAGLYEHWRGEDGDEIESFVILTTEANEAVRPLHDRMPVLLERNAWARWLDADAVDAKAAAAMLGPCDAGMLAMHPVSRRVNRPGADDASLIEPIEQQARMFD